MARKFREKSVRKVDTEGWMQISRDAQDAQEVWVREDESGVTWKRVLPGPTPALYQNAALLMQAGELGLPNSFLGKDKRSVIVPDWGVSFLYRRQTLGWQYWLEDILSYERALTKLYPKVCFWDIALRNCVINPETGEASQPDVRSVMTEAEAQSQFPSQWEYRDFVRGEIERSLIDHFQEHADEFDLIQEKLEASGESNPTPTPDAYVSWPD